MRILVTGSRDWEDSATIGDALQEAAAFACSPVTLISGACPKGADAIAEQWGEFFGWTVERYPARWNEHARDCSNACKARDYCKRAGFRRNAEMVGRSPNVCLAFIRNGSRGASMTADLARAHGVPVRRFTA